MNNIKKFVDKILSTAIIIISSILVLCVIWQVISRYLLNSPSVHTDEIARFMFMWVGLIGAAYASSLKRHLAIDLLTQKLSGVRKTTSEVVIILATITFVCIVMIYGGASLVSKTLASGQISPSLRIPMGYVYAAIPVSGIAILFYSVVDLISKFNPPAEHDMINNVNVEE